MKSAADPSSDQQVGNDDYSLERVPDSARYSWFSVATVRFGQLSSFSTFMIGAALGLGLTFWKAVLAITLGAVLLEIVTIFIGVIGVREGLSTSMLARWTGFGKKGSALIGLLIAVSSVGWFGVQNAYFAEGLHSLVGGIPVEAWSVIGGLAVTALVVFGFRGMAWAAYVTVPAFLLLAGWAVIHELSNHSISQLVTEPPPGKEMSLAAAATLVAGGFIIGAVLTPDLARFNRTTGDVVKQTLLGVTLGEYVIGLSGVLLAHAIGTDNVVAIITSTSGVFGTIVLVSSIVKVNDFNLYASSLSVVNTLDLLFKRQSNRSWITIIVGVLGTLLSVVGILDHFQGFLEFLGTLTPPVAGIMVAEYFIVRAWRGDLEASKARGELPSEAPNWVPASLVAWAAGTAVGLFVPIGIPAINSLVVAFAAYILLGAMKLVRRQPATVEGAATKKTPKPTERRQLDQQAN